MPVVCTYYTGHPCATQPLILYWAGGSVPVGAGEVWSRVGTLASPASCSCDRNTLPTHGRPQGSPLHPTPPASCSCDRNTLPTHGRPQGSPLHPTPPPPLRDDARSQGVSPIIPTLESSTPPPYAMSSLPSSFSKNLPFVDASGGMGNISLVTDIMILEVWSPRPTFSNERLHQGPLGLHSVHQVVSCPFVQ